MLTKLVARQFSGAEVEVSAHACGFAGSTWFAASSTMGGTHPALHLIFNPAGARLQIIYREPGPVLMAHGAPVGSLEELIIH